MINCSSCSNKYQELLPHCTVCFNPNPRYHILKPNPTSIVNSVSTRKRQPNSNLSSTPKRNRKTSVPASLNGSPARAPISPVYSKPFRDLQNLIAAANHRKGVVTNFETVRAYIYKNFYRRPTEPRVTVTEDQYSLFLGNLKSSSYYNNIDCQFELHAQQKGNKSVPIDKSSVEQMQAIRHVRKAHRSDPKSRLTLTFSSGKVSEIFRKIAGFHIHYLVIDNFKMMGLNLFGQGPDDVVLYLNKGKGSTEVKALVSALARDSLLVTCLGDCSPAPLSLQHACTGIYAVDIPNLNAEQMECLHIQKKHLGSAGWLSCSMATRIALYTRPSDDRGLPSEEDYMVATKDLCSYLSINF